MMKDTGENMPNARDQSYVSTRGTPVAPALLKPAPAASVMAQAARAGRSAAPEPFGALVKRVDQDRWLASRFAPPAARARLETLYAFAFEVSRIGEMVSEAGLGAIRLAWWRDVIGADPGAAGDGGPLAAAIRDLCAAGVLEGEPLGAMIAARSHDFEAAPFLSWVDLEAYLDATAGALVGQALRVCLPGGQLPRQANACAQLVGRAWGFTGLMRAAPIWHRQGRTFLPRKLLTHFNTSPEAIFGKDGSACGGHMAQQAQRAVLERAGHAYAAARDMARIMPPAAFPAIGYLALEPGYRKAMLAGESTAERSLLARQAQLVAASALGRL